MENEYDGFYKKNETHLKNGLLPDGFPIVTEVRRITRQSAALNKTDPEQQIVKGRAVIKEFCNALINNINDRISLDDNIKLIKEVFYN